MKVERRTVLQLLLSARLAPGQEHRVPAPAPVPRKAPIYFTDAPYKLLADLCERIVPGAREASVPEFIDLLASENEEYQRELSGGLLWLDATCRDRHGSTFLGCAAVEQKQILDEIGYAGQSPGAVFFAFLRNLTLDGYFTSRVGIEYLGYRGNGALPEFRGCPGPPSTR